MKIRRFYEFGPFRINIEEGLLLRDGEQINLSVKPFELLLALVKNRGQVVGIAELVEQIWPDIHDPEDKKQDLHRLVHELRKKLGDVEEKPKYVETLPKRGYRFIAKVSEVCLDENGQIVEPPRIAETIANAVTEAVESLALSGETAAAFAMPSSSSPSPLPSGETAHHSPLKQALDGLGLIVNGLVSSVYEVFRGAAEGFRKGIQTATGNLSEGIVLVLDALGRMWRVLLLAGTLVLAFLMLLWWWQGKIRIVLRVALAIAVFLLIVRFFLWWWRRKPKGQTARVRSLAVIPFTVLNSPGNHQDMETGLTHLLLAKLIPKLPGVRICDGLRYRGAEPDLKEIGKQLHVDAVLKGTLQWIEGEIAVTAHLVSTRPGEQILWAGSFRQIFTNVLVVQDTLSQLEAEELGRWFQLNRRHPRPKNWRNPLSQRRRTRLFIKLRRFQRRRRR